MDLNQIIILDKKKKKGNGFSFVLSRYAWSSTIDFYTGARYKCYLALTQKLKSKKRTSTFENGGIAVASNVIELFLSSDPTFSPSKPHDHKKSKEEAFIEDHACIVSYSLSAGLFIFIQTFVLI